MNCLIRSICSGVAAGIVLGLAQVAPAGAQDAMKSTMMDCSKADSMMMQPDTAMQATKPTGDVDKDFAQMMMMHNGAMMAMVKAEVACGKDPATKAAAQKLLIQANANAAQLKKLLGGG